MNETTDGETDKGLFGEDGSLRPPGGEACDPSPGSWRALAASIRDKTERVRLIHVKDEGGVLEWRILSDHMSPVRQSEIREALDEGFRSASRVVTIKGQGAQLIDKGPGDVLARAKGFRDHHRWMHTFLTRLQKILMKHYGTALYQEGSCRYGYRVRYGSMFPTGVKLPWNRGDDE